MKGAGEKEGCLNHRISSPDRSNLGVPGQEYLSTARVDPEKKFF